METAHRAVPDFVEHITNYRKDLPTHLQAISHFFRRSRDTFLFFHGVLQCIIAWSFTSMLLVFFINSYRLVLDWNYPKKFPHLRLHTLMHPWSLACKLRPIFPSSFFLLIVRHLHTKLIVLFAIVDVILNTLRDCRLFTNSTAVHVFFAPCIVPAYH